VRDTNPYSKHPLTTQSDRYPPCLEDEDTNPHCKHPLTVCKHQLARNQPVTKMRTPILTISTHLQSVDTNIPGTNLLRRRGHRSSPLHHPATLNYLLFILWHPRTSKLQRFSSHDPLLSHTHTTHTKNKHIIIIYTLHILKSLST
jgi:hypothetical protein